jgi:PEP-CTERM motif
MFRPSRIASLVASFALLVTFGQGTLHADLIVTVSPTVTPEAGGLFLFNYSVSNSPTSTVGVAEFDLTVSTAANLTSITNPTGFLDLYTPGDTFISYLSGDPTTDIAPGSSGAFSFVASVGPAAASDLFRGYDLSGNLTQSTGFTLAPAAVPEPSVLVLLAIGGLCLIGARSRRSLHSTRKIEARTL